MQTAKKLLSLILCVLMCCSFASFSAFAENDTEFNAEAVATADSSVTSEITVDDISSDEFEETENISENVELTSYGEVELTATGLSGAGTSNSPYLIRTESDLLELSKSTDASFLSAYFQLQNDITLTTDNWSPIGINTSTPFKGTFDGNGHKINNVSIPENSYSYAGLFGVVTGTIKNLGVSSDIAGCSTAGALAGYVNEGTVEYCYSSGAVSSTSGNTGGLIGYIRNATVHDCYSVATSTNTDGSVGGLVGHIRSYDVCTIRDCYATGTVTGSSSNSGGIVGSKDGSGSNNILGCYYNSSTTKQSDTGKGFSITSSKMKTQDTFTAWDFDYVWAIDGSTNNGYPYLQLPITETKEDIELEGSGNEVDPYIITNETELIALARGELINSFTAYYQLANDITVNSDYWTPIGGNGRDYFSGTFDGNGHTISGIKLSQAAFEYSGLFGIVSGTVKNLGVDVKISGTGTAGALAGYVYEGTVEYCYSSGAVSGTSGYTGGLIGYIRNATVHDCYSVATVTNTNSNGNTGGLVGNMFSNNVCTIKDCYAAGTVTSASSYRSGGIVGSQGGGSNNVLGCYYNSSTTKQSDTGKGFSVTSAKMKSQNTFTAWDFDYVWEIDGSTNSGYPYLQLPITDTREDIELEGSGNEIDPYIITNETELIALARGELINSFTAYYQLANDITVTSDYWTPIGGNGRDYFSGTFDGNGHTISGIKLSQAAFDYSGLFGVVSGTVKNLGVDAKISGAETAGALAGYVNEGTVEYCYSSGAVSSTSGNTGGLIGYLYEATVHDCYSVATVTNTNSNGNTGGLVGNMFSNNVCTIKDCYAAGTVTSASSYRSGGIVGSQGGSSNNVLSCYYDNYSGSSTNKGTLVSTEAMKTQSTFTGWDFTTVWALSATKNNGYPYLQNVSTEIQAIAVTGITLDKSTLSVPVGRTAAIKANITPANATNKNVTWTSLNPNVATVNNGSVTGIAEGTAVIVALTEDGSFTATCTVTVTTPVAAAYPYEITALSLETEAGEALSSAPTGSNFIVNVELMEIQERSERDYLFVAVYDTDGSLLSMNYIKSDFVPNQVYNLGINIQAQTKPIGKIKTFVWDGFNGMDPLAETKELQ